MTNRRIAIAAMATSALALSGLSRADQWPTKPVTVVVPYPPGGFTDVIARVVGQSLQKQLAQPVVVVNRPGAGGNIGAQFVAHSAPDGHTLLVTSHVLVYSSLAFRKTGIDLPKRVTPVVAFGSSTGFVVTGAKSGINSLPELIEKARKNPGKVKLATAGGSGGPFPVFLKSVNAKVTMVPYQGNAAAIPDVISGDVDMMVASPDTVGAFVANGTMKVLANASSLKRSSFYPDAPVLSELYKNDTVDRILGDGFIGLSAPVETPVALLDRINALVADCITKDPELRGKFEKAALSPEQNFARAEFERTIDRELLRSKALLDVTGEYVN